MLNVWELGGVMLVALCTSLLVLATRRWHVRWTGDFANSGIQKHHEGSPPRVGFLPILAGLGVAAFLLSRQAGPIGQGSAGLLGLLILASLPAVGLGLVEDLTKIVSPRLRFAGAMLASLLGIALLDTRIHGIGLPGIDSLFAWAWVSVPFTMLMVTGFTNAVNIVDGLNGLAGGLASLMLGATGAAAYMVGDMVMVQTCIAIGAALAGFLLINYPRGLMFLGDGGAYFLGFALVQIWILLVNRNPEVSPWFVLSVASYTTIETIFSIYRRRFRGRRPRAAMAPDRLHLHSLIYRRLTRKLSASMTWGGVWLPNALAATIIVCAAALPVMLALVNPRSLLWNVALCVGSLLLYLWAFAWATRARRKPTMRDLSRNGEMREA